MLYDVMPFMNKAHCVVLPTFHPEGVSNVLLEAAACARPIIATDRVGCRDAVENNLTGLLIKEKDSNDLVDKMERFMKIPYVEKIQMGIAGRKKIEKEFDRNIVVNAYIEELDLIKG